MVDGLGSTQRTSGSQDPVRRRRILAPATSRTLAYNLHEGYRITCTKHIVVPSTVLREGFYWGGRIHRGEAMDYIRRVVDSVLDELLPSLPAIALEGPRAVGKTRTSMRRAKTVHRLDDPAQRQVIQAQPTRLVEGPAPILIDEWQRVPESWDVVRRAVDDDPTPGRFLLTGSATPTDRPTHSGAGRIVTVRMRPLTLAERDIESPTVSLRDLLNGEAGSIEGRTEVTLSDYTEEIVASGFPGLRAFAGRARREQLDGYLRRIAEVDFEELGRSVRRPGTLRRWMTAYAAATATTASYETIRDAATGGEGDKPSHTTTRPYRDILGQLWIIDHVPAWIPSSNYLSQLTRSPKHHLADPGLSCSLLGIGSGALLKGEESGPGVPRDGTLLGHLFESLVTLSVRVYAGAAEAELGHLRTRGGRHEVDLIVRRRDNRVVALEVKVGRTVDDEDVAHLHWLRERIGEDLLDAAVITAGSQAYRRPDGIAVVPAVLLGP